MFNFSDFASQRKWGLIIFFAALVVCSLYRITLGVDLSDEAYYATFIDGWFKTGFANTKNQIIHQTSAFLVFPIAYLYKLIVGSTTGLILFLRLIYLFVSISAMAPLFFLIKRLRNSLIATLTLGFGFLFIPFSLPAPSYNTLGMFGMVGAMSLFGIAVLNLNKNKPVNKIAFFSALCWVITVIAYPSLIVAFGGLICFSYVFLQGSQERALIKRYIGIFIILAGCGFGVFLLTFGYEHLVQMVKFAKEIQQVFNNPLNKFHNTILLLIHNKTFSLFSVLSLLLGVVLAFSHKNAKLSSMISLVISGLIVYSFSSRPVLFMQSHDIVMLLALWGIYIPLGVITQRALSKDIPNVVCVMYCTSILAGLVTTITATHGFFNFPIGGILAACLSLAFIPTLPSLFPRISQIILLLVATFSMLILSYKFMYGERYGMLFFTPSERISSGVFAGLRTTTQQANLIYSMQKLLPQNCKEKGGSVTVLGRLSGIYLLTCLAPNTITTWNFPTNQANQLKMVEQFYQQPSNQPDLIFRYIDRWGKSLTAAEGDLIKKYDLMESIKIDEFTFISTWKLKKAVIRKT